MKVLFVNACPRGEASRTLGLARAFLEELNQCLPDAQVTEQALPRMGLRPVDAATLAQKEALCDHRAWDHPLMRAGAAFQAADAVVIAAPYWDLSFPAMLKIWVENVYIRNLTFRYEDDRCIGLCRGQEAVYLTTAGSPIGEHDWGAGYMRAVLQTLGIPRFTAIGAQGLDLAGRDPEAILGEAEAQCRIAAREMARRLTSTEA